MSLEAIARKAKRYGETKRGHDELRVLTGPRGVRVEATDGTRLRDGEVQLAELALARHDEGTARVCDLIDRLLHELREMRK